MAIKDSDKLKEVGDHVTIILNLKVAMVVDSLKAVNKMVVMGDTTMKEVEIVMAVVINLVAMVEMMADTI